MKYLKKFEKNWDANLYGLSWIDMFDLRKYEDNIQIYFFEKYPNKTHILNKEGHINEITLNILFKFAQKRKDIELIKLIDIFKKEIEHKKIEKNTKKYNL